MFVVSNLHSKDFKSYNFNNFNENIHQCSPLALNEEHKTQSQNKILNENIIKNSLSKDLQYTKEDEKNKEEKLFSIFSEVAKKSGDIITANGNATLISKNFYVLSDEIIYNNALKQIKLNGNIKIYKDNELYIETKRAIISLDSNFGIIEPFYIQESLNGIWMTSDVGIDKNEEFSFQTSVISACQINAPAWRIDGSSGTYDRKNQVISLWNAVLYLGDIPVFYIPWIQIPTDKKRRSGILYPTVGSTSSDGLVYIQPYYFAPRDFFDMTFFPQIRTNRGYGINYEFRAIDKYQDRYFVNVRYFHNANDDYVKHLNLINRYVYGISIKHSKRNFLKKLFNVDSNTDNGFYFSYLNANDLDYLNLDKLSSSSNTSSYISKFNMFFQNNKDYLGISMKYHLNLSTIDNSKTIQNIPNIHYHSYLNTLFFKEILYSLDYKFKNSYRVSGYGFVSNEISVPIGMQFSVFQKYASFGVWNNLQMGNIYINNTKNTLIFNDNFSSTKLNNQNYKYGNYISANYRISLNVDIGKKYDNFFHYFQSKIYVISPFSKGVFTNGILNRSILESYKKLNEEKLMLIQNGEDILDPTIFNNVFSTLNLLNFEILNYFYRNNGKKIFIWTSKQVLNLDENVNKFRIPFENKLEFFFNDHLSMNASIFYSLYFNAFTEFALNSKVDFDHTKLDISYFLKRDNKNFTLDPTTLTFRHTDSSNYLKTSLKSDFFKYGFNLETSFDIKTATFLNYSIGISRHIGCFGIDIKFGNDKRVLFAKDKNNVTSVIENKYIKFEFKLAPLTSFDHSHRFQSSKY